MQSAQNPRDRAATALELIAAARPRYLCNRRADVAALLLAHEQRDLETLRTLSHRMKGTGASYGFPDVSAIGAQIEAAGRASNLEAAELAIQRLRSFLDEAEQNTE
jgi:HPt (histidine-containing phosphotransfer) domain-containing protein